jgi:hypothetical protein
MRDGTAIAAAADVVKVESVEALADRCFSTFGNVDVLCNNAGVAMRPFRAAWVASVADYKWMMDVNYFGVVHGILAFVPRMRQQTGHTSSTRLRSLLSTSQPVTVRTERRRLRCRACPTHCGKSFANTVTISGLRSSIPVRYARGSQRASGFARRISGPQAVASNHTDRRMTASTWRILKFLIPSRSATSWSTRCARTHRHRSLILRQPISSKLDSRLSSRRADGRTATGNEIEGTDLITAMKFTRLVYQVSTTDSRARQGGTKMDSTSSERSAGAEVFDFVIVGGHGGVQLAISPVKAVEGPSAVLIRGFYVPQS